MLNLYNLSDEYLLLLEEEEITLTMEERLESIQQEFSEKAISIGGLIKTLRENKEIVENELRRLRDKDRNMGIKIQTLQDWLLYNMVNLGHKKIESALYNVSVKNNPTRVHVIDEDSIPNQYKMVKIEETIDKTKIKGDILNGVYVTGAALIQDKRIEVK